VRAVILRAHAGTARLGGIVGRAGQPRTGLKAKRQSDGEKESGPGSHIGNLLLANWGAEIGLSGKGRTFDGDGAG
jgi:hypothetical protein